MNNYSPNMLNTFDECQQKFFFKYIEKLSMPQPSAMFEKGKKIHALANYYLKGFDISKMEKTLNENEKVVWETLKNSKYFNLNAVETEYNLSCKIDKYWVGGRLDALMLNNQTPSSHAELVSASIQQPATERSRNEFGMTQDYVILDYKTGNIPQNAQWDFQTIVYLLCADKFLNKKGGYGTLKFIYLGLKNNVEKEVEITETLKKEYEEKIIQTCSKIDFAQNRKVFEKNKEKCAKCEYQNLCNN